MQIQKIFSYILLAVSVYFSVTGCQQAIRIDEDDYESKAVVFGMIGADSVVEIFLTQSIRNTGWVEESQTTQFITDAEVEMNDGTETELLKYLMRYDKPYFAWGDNDSILVHLYQGEQTGVTGKEYSLSFKYKEKTVEGNAKIPIPVSIDQVEKKEITESDGFDTWTYNVIRTTIQDRAGEANAYRFYVEFSAWDYFGAFDPVSGEYLGRDSILETIQRRSYFELDEQRDGEEIAIDIETPYNNTLLTRLLPDGRTMYYQDYVLWIETAEISIGKYVQSLTDQQWNSGDPLAEPVFLKSNIENGLGIFGGYSMSDTVHFRYVEYIQ